MEIQQEDMMARQWIAQRHVGLAGRSLPGPSKPLPSPGLGPLLDRQLKADEYAKSLIIQLNLHPNLTPPSIQQTITASLIFFYTRLEPYLYLSRQHHKQLSQTDRKPPIDKFFDGIIWHYTRCLYFIAHKDEMLMRRYQAKLLRPAQLNIAVMSLRSLNMRLAGLITSSIPANLATLIDLYSNTTRTWSFLNFFRNIRSERIESLLAKYIFDPEPVSERWIGTMEEIWTDAMAYRQGLGVMEGFGGTQSGKDYAESRIWKGDPLEECRKSLPRRMSRPGFTVLVHGGTAWTELEAVRIGYEEGEAGSERMDAALG